MRICYMALAKEAGLNAVSKLLLQASKNKNPHLVFEKVECILSFGNKQDS